MKVLLAVDGSEPSELAVASVLDRTWKAGTEVRVLTVVENVLLPSAAQGFEPTVGLEPVQLELEKSGQALAARVAGSLTAAGIPAEPHVRHGDPRAVIVDAAEEWGADLIVVGSHGYRGLQRWLLGSVAQAVVAHAPCSVEVVRRRADRETASSSAV